MSKILKTNYHTHTLFCDGEHSAEDMVLSAIEHGMTSLGFSAHASYPISTQWHMPIQNYWQYAAEICRLKKKYAPSIDIFLGFEADYIPPVSFPDKKAYNTFCASPRKSGDQAFQLDYLIGSIHYLVVNLTARPFSVDGSTEDVATGIKDVFGGDGKKAVQSYYQALRDMCLSQDFDIVGHPDVIRKRNGALHFFDESETWYLEELEKTAAAIGRSGKIVEINTGGIARGAINDSYPSLDFLTFLSQNKVPITINSDAHSKNNIDCAFDAAIEKAKKAGYSSKMHLSREDGTVTWKSTEL